MNITIIGTGYVGLVSGTCLAEFGHGVTCLDIDRAKIENLNNGIIPIYEPGLESLVKKNQSAGRLSFTTDYESAVTRSTVIFIAVGTPPREDGSADLQYVLAAAGNIADHINGYKVIVNKSTVPVGTGAQTKKVIADTLARRGCAHSFDVVSNPEFLREGAAVKDFMHPDRIVIGCESAAARDIMEEVYRALYINSHPFIVTGIETAELIKYASNAFLAVKISFINEMSRLCENVGADVQQVARGMGLDNRIGKYFLHAGPGYGGSCFPKDTQALARIGDDAGVEMSIVRSAIGANESQKAHMAKKLESVMGGLSGKKIAVLGLAFKPETDDMRESPAIAIVNNLLDRGAVVRVYDPIAMENARRYAFEEKNITYCRDEYDAIIDSDAVMLITEWNQFRNLDMERVKAGMRGNVFFDCRNIYSPESLERYGLVHVGVGR